MLHTIYIRGIITYVIYNDRLICNNIIRFHDCYLQICQNIGSFRSSQTGSGNKSDVKLSKIVFQKIAKQYSDLRKYPFYNNTINLYKMWIKDLKELAIKKISQVR